MHRRVGELDSELVGGLGGGGDGGGGGGGVGGSHLR